MLDKSAQTAILPLARAYQNDAARHQEIAAGIHRDAGKQCESRYFERAHGPVIAAAKTHAAVNQHDMQALDFYRHHAEEVAARKQEAAADQAAREAKRQAKG